MYKYIKRILDFILSLLGIVVLLPLFIILSAIIKIDSKGPVLFVQKRVGIHKKHFNIYKFRSMYEHTPKDNPTHMMSDPEKHITGIGIFLRKTSLDELPQLINILKGDMSIIGPRPALWNQYDLVEERDKYGANDILPGLTGWAQVNGRDELQIPYKAELDGYYTNNMCFALDMKCFFKTISCIFKKDGIVEGGTGALSRTDNVIVEHREETFSK